MIGLVITLLLTITFLTAIAVLVPSLKQAWLAYGELKRALSLCADDRVVTVRVENGFRPTQPRRHPRATTRSMPIRTGAMRAAA